MQGVDTGGTWEVLQPPEAALPHSWRGSLALVRRHWTQWRHNWVPRQVSKEKPGGQSAQLAHSWQEWLEVGAGMTRQGDSLAALWACPGGRGVHCPGSLILSLPASPPAGNMGLCKGHPQRGPAGPWVFNHRRARAPPPQVKSTKFKQLLAGLQDTQVQDVYLLGLPFEATGPKEATCSNQSSLCTGSA